MYNYTTDASTILGVRYVLTPRIRVDGRGVVLSFWFTLLRSISRGTGLMKLAALILTATATILLTCCSAHAGSVPIGDFRIGSNDVPANTNFDPGVDFGTRSVVGAPVQVNSIFSAASQQANGTVESTDVELRTFSSASNIRNLSRFNPSQDGGQSGPSRVGMVQWSFDLTPLDTYLTSNSLVLTNLDLDLITDNSDDGKKLDIYLSYTNLAESISLAGIDNTNDGGGDQDAGSGNLNWTNFYNPARGSSVGDVINGTHRVLAVDQTGDVSLSEDLLALYNSGVREVNFQIAAGDFWSGRQISVKEGSGLSIDTEVIPEPASGALMSLACVALFGMNRRIGA